jgi:HD superfamily phosphodiesterase
MDFEGIKKVIIEKLKNDLPKQLTYHNVEHTLDVINAVKRISTSENINGDDLTLLKTAALFHDSGYLYGYDGHEEISCKIAQKYLPHYGYTPEQVGKVKEIIMATKMPQSPQNHLEEIMADADLDYLGRDDFFSIDSKLYDELKSTGKVTGERDWDVLQEKFLEDHSYFTGTSKSIRNKKKSENLKTINLRIANNKE